MLFRSDQAFEGTDTDIDNPYEEDIPEDCPDLPCEWHLLGDDVGDYDDKMGLHVKERLEEYADHNNPEGEVVSPEPCDGNAESYDEVDGQTVCDLNGDGHYRDVNGDGTLTNGDVTTFFENQHAPAWDERTDLFDFTGDDNVGQADVIELFAHV